MRPRGPSIARSRARPSRFELLEMRADVLARRRHERRRRDHHRWIRRSPPRSRCPAASAASTCCSRSRRCSRYAVSTRARIVDRRAVRRQQPRGLERAGCARARRDTGRGCRRGSQWIITLLPSDDESPVKTVRARLVPEREMIRRMPGRVQRDQRLVAASNAVAVGERHATPRRYCASSSGHGYLQKARVRMRCRERRRARCVIRMAVRDEHVRQARAAARRARARCASRCRGVADAGIDERRACRRLRRAGTCCCPRRSSGPGCGRGAESAIEHEPRNYSEARATT